MSNINQNSVNIPAVPQGLDPAHRDFLTQVRNAVVRLQGSLTPAGDPSNIRVTPVAGGNIVAWTRSDADRYTVLWSSTPNLSQAVAVDAGQSQQWFDNIGKNGVQRWYWVGAAKDGVPPRPPIGPISGTSLAMNAATTVPAPPAPASPPSVDSTSGHLSPSGIQGDTL